MIQLYLTPLPERTGDDATDQIGSQVEQAGLLDTGGTSVENVATENVDFRKQGRIQYGTTLSKKVAEELDSLSESSYTTLALYDATGGRKARKRGYYEVTRIDVSPAQEARNDVYEYDSVLTLAGTREDSQRRVRTNPQTVDSFYAVGSPEPVAIPAAATRVRWYDDANGTEAASAVSSAMSEFGGVEFYQPDNASFDTPSLIYDLDFAEEGNVDVRVYDDRDREKIAETASGGQVSVWTHAYHTGYQFEGKPVVDTGRLRVYLDDDAGSVSAETYNTNDDVWDKVGLTMGDYTLEDFSFESIGPASVTVRVTLRDKTDGSEGDTFVKLRRGRDKVLLTPAAGETIYSDDDAANVFGTLVSTQTTDPMPSQGLIDRTDL